MNLVFMVKLAQIFKARLDTIIQVRKDELEELLQQHQEVFRDELGISVKSAYEN